MTDIRKFEKLPTLTGLGTGICCIFQAVYKKDAALQTRLRSFASASRQPISEGREKLISWPCSIPGCLQWDKTTYRSPLSVDALHPRFGFALSSLSRERVRWSSRLQPEGCGGRSRRELHGHVSPAGPPWVSYQVFFWASYSSFWQGCGFCPSATEGSGCN